MSWDIYGNPLRRGYCEVHPDVHQEYPCSICMAQKQQQSQPHNELEQLQYEFAQQGDYIRHLESERAALAAQVQALGDKLSEVVALLDVDGMTAVQWLLDNCPEIESLTDMEPQHHLRELRAEAVLYAVKFFAPALDIETESLEWYAAKVRQGGKP